MIDPAEKIVDNVVYYEVTIDFSNQAEGIKSGMTADIVIETNKKDNVLMIPKNSKRREHWFKSIEEWKEYIKSHPPHETD